MKIDKQMIGSILAAEMSEEEGGELIQMIAPDEEDTIESDVLPDDLPILAVRNTVLFPGVLIPITVGRQKSIRVVKQAYKGNKIIGVLTQENPKIDDPKGSDLFKVGTVAKIVKMLVLPDGNTTIIVQGKQRFLVKEYVQEAPVLKAKVEYLKENFPKRHSKEVKAIIQSIRDTGHFFNKYPIEMKSGANCSFVCSESLNNSSF